VGSAWDSVSSMYSVKAFINAFAVCQHFIIKSTHICSYIHSAPSLITLLIFSPLPSTSPTVCAGNPDAKRLYDDLLSNYNKLVRPVVNVTDALTVRIKLKLSQLIDVVRASDHVSHLLALITISFSPLPWDN
jgi:Neurotransmitter-gated ion-channel ligand binding domain